jgi:hypothetical protein
VDSPEEAALIGKENLNKDDTKSLEASTKQEKNTTVDNLDYFQTNFNFSFSNFNPSEADSLHQKLQPQYKGRYFAGDI